MTDPSPKKLVSLHEHDLAMAQAHQLARAEQPRPNGIACPRCGNELFDSRPTERYACSPPRMSIQCYAAGCGYTGTRIA